MWIYLNKKYWKCCQKKKKKRSKQTNWFYTVFFLTLYEKLSYSDWSIWLKHTKPGILVIIRLCPNITNCLTLMLNFRTSASLLLFLLHERFFFLLWPSPLHKTGFHQFQQLELISLSLCSLTLQTSVLNTCYGLFCVLVILYLCLFHLF